MIPAIAPPPGDVLGLKERNIHDWWSPADDPFMPREVLRGAHLHKRHRWRCVRQQCPAGRPSACISINGLKNKMQEIRILYLVGSAQCKHETYAISYIVLWYSYGGPS